MKIRKFTFDDLPKLVRLLNETHKDSYEFTPYTEEDLGSWIRDEHLEILIAEENGEFLGSTAYEDSHWGEEIVWLAVSKNANQKLVEDALVSEIEKYVKGEKVFTTVDADSPKIDEWKRRGYTPEGGLYHMVVDINGLKPLPEVPKGVILRSLRVGEEKKLVEAVNKSFGWERLKIGVINRWKKENPPFNEDWVHVAEINSKIVSVVVSRPNKEYNEFYHAKRGYLGPAATLPEYRGKNLASALTCRAMNFLFEKGMDSAALYTTEQNVASVALLTKLGFRIGHYWKFLRKNISHGKDCLKG